MAASDEAIDQPHVMERQPLNVCLVGRELYDWGCSTESAAAARGLAQLIAGLGDSVTFLWVPWKKQKSAGLQKLKENLYNDHLIRLEVLDEFLDHYAGSECIKRASLWVYDYLKTKDFDAIYFCLEGGLAYYSLLSRETGVSQLKAKMSVIANTPLEWCFEADKTFFSSSSQVTISHMENYCAQAADTLICGSSYMLEWLQQRGGRGAANSEILPTIKPNEASVLGHQTRVTGSNRVDEVVFFSGLEFRNGFSLFCEAVNLLPKSLTHITVTVLGAFGTVNGEHSGGMLLRYGGRWPFSIKMLNRLKEGERVQYLKERNCLAVIPSLKANVPLPLLTCLDEGIPFVATNVGGIQESIAKKDWGRCLCAPEALELMAKIISAIEERSHPIAPRLNSDERRSAWAAHLTKLATSKVAGVKKNRVEEQQRYPLVSVILVHHDRPHYLPQAVASVEQQDYPNFELIVVDDGSKLPESQAILDQLETRFCGKKDRRLLREPNRYVGAARKAGVRAGSGELVLFVDDDNALFKNAISTFVRAIEVSGSDLCLAFYRTYYGPVVPDEQQVGSINYLPLGGSLDLAMFNNTIGDAGAMLRRDVFDKIGFQMEKYGVAGEDWEFYTRAIFAGMKLRVIPEPLYWYRSNVDGMYRTSNWYDTRLAILDVYRKHNFAGVEHAFHLLIAQNVGDENRNLQLSGLQYSVSNKPYLELARLDPNSDKALGLLAQIAAAEGRSDTALTLLGQLQISDFRRRVADTLNGGSASQQALAELGCGFFSDRVLDVESLRGFALRSRGGNAEPPNFYTEMPDSLYIEARGTAPVTAVLVAGCPAGTSSISAQVQIGDPIGDPIEFLLLMAPSHLDADVAVAQAMSSAAEGSSGWCTVSRPCTARQISASLSLPSSQAMNLIVAVRQGVGGSRARTLGSFEKIVIHRALGWDAIQRPRLGSSQYRQRARILDQTDLGKAKLVTNHRSDLPELLVAPKGGGLFLRPNSRGPVAAVLPSIFPPFAKKVVGSVEIAHEEASAFEFAMVLTKPERSPDWRRDVASQVVAFSGWQRVEEKFELHEISVEVGERVNTHLSLELAIRVPRGSKPMPANTFWRKLVLVWEE